MAGTELTDIRICQIIAETKNMPDGKLFSCKSVIKVTG